MKAALAIAVMLVNACGGSTARTTTQSAPLPASETARPPEASPTMREQRPLSPMAQAIADYLTREEVPFERDALEPSLRLERTFSRGRMDYQTRATTTWGEFTFSERMVLIVFNNERRGMPEPPARDAAHTAIEVTRGWLGRHRSDLLEHIDAGLFEHSVGQRSGQTRVAFERVKRPHEVSIRPYEVILYVGHSCNCVRSFRGYDADFSRTTPPALDEAAAQALISQRYPRVSVDSLDLRESLVGPYQARTVYIAELTVAVPGVYDRHPHVFWVFDADTGETIERLGDPREAPIRPPLPEGVEQ